MEQTTPEAQISVLLESISGPCAVLDEDGIVVLVNQEWRDFGEANGLTYENHALGSNYLAVCAAATGEGARDARRLHQGLLDVIDGRQTTFKHAYPCHSPVEQRWYQCQVKRLSSSDPETCLLVHHADISEQIQLLEERQRREALEMAHDVMQQFLLVLSHDLRGPLRAIVEFTRLIKERHVESLPEEAGEFFAHIEKGGERMSALLDGLMRYVRATDMRDERRACDLGEIVHEAWDEIEETRNGLSAELTVDGKLPTVIGYPELIKRVFHNLFENAIKYRGEAPLRILVRAEEQRRDWQVVVSDNGTGIAPRNAERVFRIFHRLEPSDEVSGAGVGLTICSKIAEIHGGRIWVDTDYDEGARFRFTIGKGRPRRSSPADQDRRQEVQSAG